MKLHIMSDLHLEFSHYNWLNDPVTADVLILAGDIGLGSEHGDWVISQSDRYRYILLVAGNHEYYRQNYRELRAAWPKIQDSWNEKSLGAKIYFLDPGSVEVDGIKFIGATLWTDFHNDDFAVKMAAQNYMSDYSVIKDFDKDISPPLTLSPNTVFLQHKADLDFIKQEMRAPGKKVVITHHAPSYQSIAGDYRKSRHELINYCYHTPLDSLVDQVDLWIHGHVHTNFNYEVGRGRVICNPRGYAGYDLNPGFKPDLVVDV